MPDLTLDAYRGVSEEELRRILKRELRKLLGPGSRDPEGHPDDTPARDMTAGPKLDRRYHFGCLKIPDLI